VELLLLGLGLEAPLTRDGQRPVLDGDLELLRLDPRHLDGDHVGIVALGDVERGRPGAGSGLTAGGGAASLAEGLAEELVHLVLNR
jgi:hypothetical protein